MTPEAQAHLDTARLALAKARLELQASAQDPILAEDAARNSYYVAFHAAQALIVERTGKRPKTHAGVHRQFHRLAQHEPTIPQPMRDFLNRAFGYKATVDYDTLPAPRISPARAASAIQTAEQFLDMIVALLPP
jgi:uncharacterized protein (UPF0332 family)